MNYTKGEWKVREYDEGTRPFIDGFSLAVQSPKLVVALCDKDSWDNKKQRLANANLIAAAPDMYEALRELHSPPKHPIKDCPADISSNPCTCGWHDAMDKAMKALAKAEGKE